MCFYVILNIDKLGKYCCFLLYQNHSTSFICRRFTLMVCTWILKMFLSQLVQEYFFKNCSTLKVLLKFLIFLEFQQYSKYTYLSLEPNWKRAPLFFFTLSMPYSKRGTFLSLNLYECLICLKMKHDYLWDFSHSSQWFFFLKTGSITYPFDLCHS